MAADDGLFSRPPASEVGDRDAPELRAVTLASATDFEGFRRACRTLWAEQVAPDRVSWHAADDAEGDLFEVLAPGHESAVVAPSPAAPSSPDVAPVNVPAAFMPLAESVVLHADPGRFGLLYRLLWRLQREPELRRDPLDADWARAEHMAQAVRRDMDKMKTFVRFRTIAEGDGDAPLHVAWFEPEHHIVEATAPFFMRRFAAMRWAILTPGKSVRWANDRLVFGRGSRRDEAPAEDAGEKLWLACCENIFNPARLRLKMMQKEMPERYWANLTEAQPIEPLAAGAAQRSMEMIARGPSDPAGRRQTAPQTAPEPTAPHPAPGYPETPGGDAPRTLPALREALERCRECPIGEHATQAVGGEGLKHAALMFVGEQPGDQEDLQGRPFVGPAGQLLSQALVELGIPRDKVYITNAVKHFKFELRGKRRIHKTPAQAEMAACLHWLESEIGLVDPQALVALGATAARQLMGGPIAVTRQRGQWLKRSDGRRVLITLHPSALLRVDPQDKAAAYQAWVDDLREAAAHFLSSDSHRR